LRRLLRDNPIRGAVTITLEREPDWFIAAGAEGPRHDAIVARETGTGRLVSVGTRSVRTYLVGGQTVSVPYLGALRVDRASRGRLRLLREGYALCRALRRDGEAPFALTSIVADNERARKLLGSGRAGLPSYRKLEGFFTLVIPTRGRARGGPRPDVKVDRLNESELDEIAVFLQRVYRGYRIAPSWTAGDLRSSRRTPGLGHRDFLVTRRTGTPVGCLAVWDQREFKQAVIQDYSPRLRAVRPFVNLLAPWLGVPRLPAPGSPLEHAYLSHVAVTDPDVLVPLVDAGRAEARRRGCDVVVLGMSEPNPLLPHLRRAFRHRAYRSTLYVVDWDGEAARLPPPGDGPVHVEVATL